MVFSSSIVIFFFLPVVLSGYFLLRSVKARNVWLFMVSLLFYLWGGYAFFPVILYSIALNYTDGRVLGVLQTEKHRKVRKAAFIITGVLNLLSLGYWKYTKFLVQIANLFGCGIVEKMAHIAFDMVSGLCLYSDRRKQKRKCLS